MLVFAVVVLLLLFLLGSHTWEGESRKKGLLVTRDFIILKQQYLSELAWKIACVFTNIRQPPRWSRLFFLAISSKREEKRSLFGFYSLSSGTVCTFRKVADGPKNQPIKPPRDEHAFPVIQSIRCNFRDSQLLQKNSSIFDPIILSSLFVGKQFEWLQPYQNPTTNTYKESTALKELPQKRSNAPIVELKPVISTLCTFEKNH